LGAALSPLATPYGIHVLTYYSAFVGNQAVRLADVEWGPPVFPALSFFQFVVPIGLCLVSLVLARRRGRPWPALLIGGVAVTAIAAFLAMRNNVWLGMATAVLLAETSSAWIPTREATRGFLAVASVLAVALALAGVGRLAVRSDGGYESLAPMRSLTATASYAAEHTCARVLADNLGVSALLWRYPSMAGRVAFDGRIEAYRQRDLRTWVAYQGVEGSHWQATVKPYQLLVGSSLQDSLLVSRLARLPDGVVLAREPRGIAVLNGAAASCGPAVRGAARAPA
jgi:hypothetical protein